MFVYVFVGLVLGGIAGWFLGPYLGMPDAVGAFLGGIGGFFLGFILFMLRIFR